jgi:CheY-like chemotaxis protein
MDDPPCVILLDLMMPVMSGAEFIQVRDDDAKLAQIPVVIVSAWSNEAMRVSGVQGFIGKPVGFEVLLKTVAERCSGPTVPSLPG